MIPVKLVLKGIYSYRNEQVIDFSKLTESNLFGIFGAVGSGKSTILEAISFALYGETERLNRGDERNYNMMNLKSDELLIDFIFQSGAPGDEYRFTVKGKRNKKDFSKVETFKRTAYKKNNGDWNPLPGADAEQIIGLSYENFRRTIIIPQNRFQEFLQLGDTERTRMMKDLFHLDKFELSGKVGQLEEKNKASKIELEARIEQIGIITDGQIRLKEIELTAIETKIKEDEALLKEKSVLDLQQKLNRDLLQKHSEQLLKTEQLKKKEPEFSTRESALNKYEQCTRNFKGLLDNKSTLNKRIIDRRGTLQELQEKQRLLQKEFTEKEMLFNQLKRDYEKRDDLKRKAAELTTIIEIITLEAEYEELTKKNTIAVEYIEALSNKAEQHISNLKGFKTELSDLKNSLPDLAQLSEIRHWFSVKDNHLNNISKLLEELKEIETRLKKEEIDQNRLMAEARQQLKIQETYANSRDFIALLQNVKSGLREKLFATEHELLNLTTTSKLEEYAAALQPGAPCPICGSVEHPQLLNISDVKNKIVRSNEERVSCRQQIEVIEKYITALQQPLVKAEGYTQQAARLKSDIELSKKTLENHLADFKWQHLKSDNQDELNEAFKSAETIRKQILVKEENAENLVREIEKDYQQKTKADAKLEIVRTRQTVILATIATFQTQLPNQVYDIHKKLPLETLQGKIEGLNTQYHELEQQYPVLESAINKLRNEENQLKGNIESDTRTLQIDETSFHELELQIEQALKDSHYSNVQQVETILEQKPDVEMERKKIAEFNMELHAAHELLLSLAQQAEGKSYNSDAHQILLVEIKTLTTGLNKLKADQGGLSTVVAQLKGNLTTRLSLLKKLDDLNIRSADIAQLKQLFKASGFVNYVSSMYLKNLCHSANERFHKITRQRLQLEITDTNNFIVRDFMNDGQSRSVKTLSGGQTFQAALSLALALADNIQQLTKSEQNFFFLDEGFGSLDKESLQVVFETLKTLRKENRIVGVISHVEEMQQEIDVFLSVTNHEEEGSIISASWE